MRRIMYFASVFWLGCTVSGVEAQDLKGVPGFLMPNGAFRPYAAPRATSAPAAATTVNTGAINVTVKIQISSNAAHLTPSTIKCDLIVNVFDTDGVNTNVIEEHDSYPAAISGTTGTCQLSIPYLWNLYSPGSDTVNIAVQITGLDTNGKGRTNYLTLAPIPVPTTATVTSLTVNTRL